MPIPKPNSGESESEFVSRCVSKISDEYEQEQALAICYNSYREKETMSKKEKIFILQPKKTENRGMYLARCSNNNKMRKQFPEMKKRLGFCLTSFNEYYKYWSKIEMAEVPSNTDLGDCIAREKAKGFDYKEAYAHCATKIGTKPLGIGEAINLKEDLLVEPVEFNEMDVFGYPTKYFYICPGAQKTFQDLVSSIDDEDQKGMVRSAAQIADNVFRLEAEVIEKNKSTQSDVNIAEILVNDFKDLILEIDEESGLDSDVSYMDGHIEKIKQYL